MRVGLFSECYHPIVNGVVASIDALAHGLRSDGHDVVTLAPCRIADDRAPSVRLPSLPLPTKTDYRLVLPFVNAEQQRRIQSLSVLHTHSPFVTGWLGVRFARRFGIPLVFTYHTQIEEYAHYVPFERGATRRAARTLTRTYANSADAVIVPTDAMEQRLRTLGVTAPISVIPSGIDVDFFASGIRDEALRARLGARGKHLILSVSRLGREKNLAAAISALARPELSELILALAGDGPERGSLEAHATSEGVAQRVRFLGHIDRAALPALYASADAFVFASQTETQGLVLAEAMAAGLPIVAVDAPSTRDVLGEDAILVAPTAAALAAGIRLALQSAHQSAAHLAFERFTVDLQTRRVVSLYRALGAERRSA